MRRSLRYRTLRDSRPFASPNHVVYMLDDSPKPQETSPAQSEGHNVPAEDCNPSTSLETSDEEYSAITDPKAITRAVGGLVHEAMGDGWIVHPNRAMACIFDAVNPVRQFKRGMPYDERLDFPEYPSEDCEDLTETDTAPPGWMPFGPKAYR
jgi:hypothetical protein